MKNKHLSAIEVELREEAGNRWRWPELVAVKESGASPSSLRAVGGKTR